MRIVANATGIIHYAGDTLTKGDALGWQINALSGRQRVVRPEGATIR